MTITLMGTEEARSGRPSIKLRTEGNKILLAVTNYDEIGDTLDDGTPKMTSRGDQATIIIVSGLVVTGDAVVKDDTGGDRAVETGEEVAVWFSGARWFQFLQAKKVMAAPLNVSDMLQIIYSSSEAPANPAHSRKAIWDIKWRPAKPEESEWTGKAIEAYKAASNVQLAAAAPAAEEDPF